MKRLDTLSLGAIALVATMLIHGADHQRQGTDKLTSEVMIGGTVLAVVAFTVLAATLTHHRHAALLAATIGLYTALGVTASHIAPHWSAFSNSYTNEVSVDFLSWAAMLSEVIAAFVLGAVGVRELRRRPRPATA